jgi:hypothetical protein
MNILRVCNTQILNFKNSRSLLSTLFMREAKRYSALALYSFGVVGKYDSEDRRIFSDLNQISTILEHGFYVRAS